MKRVLMVLAENNFRDCEYLVPKCFFEQSGFEVYTVSNSVTSVGKFGFEVDNDFIFEADFEELKEFDILYFVGGLGCLDYLNDELVKSLTKYFIYSNKLVAAVCAAPRLLLNWGFLEGVECTGSDYDGNFKQICDKFKGIYVDEPCVVSRNVITGVGPSHLEEFSQKIINFYK